MSTGVPPATPVTADQAANLLGVPAATIASWKTRGRVVPVGLLRTARHPTPTYNLAELRPLAEQYHRDARRKGG